jgi:hypothetical protein
MVPYVIRQGEHLQQIAHRMGFDATKVWQDSKNDDLRKLRPDPNILAAGDVLYVPDEPQWHSLETGATNPYTSPAAPTVDLSVAFSQSGKALANASCIVHGLPPPNTFQTDGDGKLKLTVPVTVRKVAVEFPDTKLILKLDVGGLDPSTERSGAWQRLVNLGNVSPEGLRRGCNDDAAFADAVRAFQSAQGIDPVTGELDDDTRKKLETAHGC